MKNKTKILLSAALVAILSLSFLFVSASGLDSTLAQAAAATTSSPTITGVVSAVESGTSTSSWSVGPIPNPIGSTVSVDIRIDGATPETVWGWTIEAITWTPSVLNITKVVQGNFLTDGGYQTLMTGNVASLWNYAAGSIEGGLACADSSSTTAQTKDTSGVLATLTFQVVGYGVASIDLSGVYLAPNDSEPPPGSSIAGVEVTANDATVTVVQPPASLIEVFTNRGGTTSNLNSGVYGPQDLVQMLALVTYNQASVANQPVSFSVENASGSVVDVRVAQTNSTGYAVSESRLPWPDSSDPQVEFGNWSITATTDLSSLAINDTVYFTYNYIVTVVNTNGIQLATSVARGSTADINVTIQNIADQPAWSTVSVTIYDSTDTPIGNFLASNSAETGASTVQASIVIPTWAFIGNATVYVDVLTNTPSASGVSYCPERVAYFQIMP